MIRTWRNGIIVVCHQLEPARRRLNPAPSRTKRTATSPQQPAVMMAPRTPREGDNLCRCSCGWKRVVQKPSSSQHWTSLSFSFTFNLDKRNKSWKSVCQQRAGDSRAGALLLEYVGCPVFRRTGATKTETNDNDSNCSVKVARYWWSSYDGKFLKFWEYCRGANPLIANRFRALAASIEESTVEHRRNES